MGFPGPAKDITRLLEENKEKIAEAIKSAATGYDQFISLLEIDKINEEYNRGESGAEEKSERMDYFIDMMEAYMTGGPSEKERHESMECFADGYQIPFSEVKEVLDYLGLEI